MSHVRGWGIKLISQNLQSNEKAIENLTTETISIIDIHMLQLLENPKPLFISLAILHYKFA